MSRKPKTKQKPKCFFDMDGTLFDYTGKLKADLKALASPGEEEIVDLYDESKPWLKARMNLIKSVPGWWRKLPKFKLGWDIYNVACLIGFKNHILTKGPSSKPTAWAEKLECIQHHLGNDISIDIVGEDKSGNYGRVLVDDYPEYVEGWLEHRPRGLVIMPDHDYNRDYQHTNVIRYSGTQDLHKISDYLCAAFYRETGQHWVDYFKPDKIKQTLDEAIGKGMFDWSEGA